MFRGLLLWALIGTISAACSSETVQPTPSVSPDAGSTNDVAGGGTDDELIDEAKAFFEDFDTQGDALSLFFTETAQYLAECAEHFGFPIIKPELAAQTGDYFHNVGQQPEQFIRVRDACTSAMEELGFMAPTTLESNGVLYDAYLDVHHCLVAGGFQTVEPPSRETFVENPGVWDPYAGLVGLGVRVFPSDEAVSSEEYSGYFEALEACPRP